MLALVFSGVALWPNYAIKPTPELALRSDRTLPPARLIAALGPMNIFRHEPNFPYPSLFLGLPVGSFLGTLLFGLVDVVFYGAILTWEQTIPDFISLWMSSIIVGLVLVVVYALPVMYLLIKVGYAGPANAFLVALLPIALLFLFRGGESLVVPVSLHSISVLLAYMYFAYIPRGA